jgi:hypothetical protein
VILAIGDSNLAPASTLKNKKPGVKNIVPFMADAMGLDYQCWARVSASNFWIEHHVRHFLASADPPTLLIVGWTSFEREEWPAGDEFISLSNLINPSMLPEMMRARYQAWESSNTYEKKLNLGKYWHQKIHDLHLELRSRSVPHLFWFTYNNFSDPAMGVDIQDWHDNFFLPYDSLGTMYSYLIAQGCQPPDYDPYHFDIAAHRIWANALIEHIKEHNLYDF